MTPPGPVVIGFAESFAAVEAVWSLQRAGFQVVVFSRRGARSALWSMPHVTVVRVPPPEEGAARTVAALDRLIETSQASAFLPLDDASLYLSTRLRLGSAAFVGPPMPAVGVALDKEQQVVLAEKAGLSVPPTAVFGGAGEVADVADVSLPVALKPADAVRLEDGRLIRPTGLVCADRRELAAACRAVGTGRVLVQPWIRGVGEGVFGLRTSAGVIAWSGHRRVRMVNPAGSASSACESAEVDPRLQERVAAFLDALDWRGMFMVELLRDAAGVPWFMELNGRAWGSLALARRRGLEYPAWAVEDRLGRRIWPEVPPDPPSVRARHLGRELLHLLFVLRGPRSAALAASWPSRARTVRALLTVRRRDRLYQWNPRQPWVALVDAWLVVAAQLRRIAVMSR